MKKYLVLFSMCVLAIGINAQTHPIIVHGNGRVASLQMTSAEFKHWNDSNDYNNADYRIPLVQDIYKKFNDDFDFIFLVYNNALRPTNLTYAGQLIGVSNAISGTGAGIYSYAAEYGSKGKLKSLMALTQNTDMLYGPSLHELIHNWGNFNINTRCFDPFGPGSGSYDFMPHWGISGCGGQLGGFDQSTLKTQVGGISNQYSASINGQNSFGQFANGGNSVPYSNYELYLMGLIPADSIITFDVFRDITALDNATGIFKADTRITYNKTKLIADFGARTPSYSSSPKKFKLMVIVLTPTALTPTEWTNYDNQVEQFARVSSDGIPGLYNFWEATGGRAILDVANLDWSLGNESLNHNGIASFEIYPNPTSNNITNITFESNEKESINILIHDQLGKVLKEQTVSMNKGTNKMEVSLQGLHSGLYFLSIGNSMLKKLVITD
jgi:hypothetical protein